MSGSAPTNTAAVQFEQQQATQAAQQEAARQARLAQGQSAIDAIFNGTPVTTTQNANYDWSTFQAPGQGQGASSAGGVPTGYTAVQIPPKQAASAMSGFGGGSSLGMGSQTAYRQPAAGASTPAAIGGGTWGLQDASGKTYAPGTPLTYQQTTDTGQTVPGTGFDSNFYNNYNQQVLNYYQPQEQQQYQQAQQQLLYSLNDAGLLNSSSAADKEGMLAQQDALQKAAIVANANQQTGQLQQQIQANKTSALNELYSTEDPTLAANLASDSAKASQLQNPTLTPMASLFSPAATAAGSAVASYASPYAMYGNPYGLGAQQGNVASASASAGKGYS